MNIQPTNCWLRSNAVQRLTFQRSLLTIVDVPLDMSMADVSHRLVDDECRITLQVAADYN